MLSPPGRWAYALCTKKKAFPRVNVTCEVIVLRAFSRTILETEQSRSSSTRVSRGASKTLQPLKDEDSVMTMNCDCDGDGDDDDDLILSFNEKFDHGSLPACVFASGSVPSQVLLFISRCFLCIIYLVNVYHIWGGIHIYHRHIHRCLSETRIQTVSGGRCSHARPSLNISSPPLPISSDGRSRCGGVCVWL